MKYIIKKEVNGIYIDHKECNNLTEVHEFCDNIEKSQNLNWRSGFLINDYEYTYDTFRIGSEIPIKFTQSGRK